MVGSDKKKRARSVEEYFKHQDAQMPSGGEVEDETGAPKTKRWFIAPTIVAGGLLVLLFVAFIRIDGLQSDITRLRLESNKEAVETLKAQVAALDSKVRKSDEEVAQLKTNITQLEKDLGDMKLTGMHRQKAEAAAKKPAADKKKHVKPARPST